MVNLRNNLILYNKVCVCELNNKKILKILQIVIQLKSKFTDYNIYKRGENEESRSIKFNRKDFTTC